MKKPIKPFTVERASLPARSPRKKPERNGPDQISRQLADERKREDLARGLAFEGFHNWRPQSR
jgi:hypothetical protein